MATVGCPCIRDKTYRCAECKAFDASAKAARRAEAAERRERNKRERAIRGTIYLSGMKPNYIVRVGLDEVHVSTMAVGNAVVRALRDVARQFEF
jgi:hypothetical protein